MNKASIDDGIPKIFRKRHLQSQWSFTQTKSLRQAWSREDPWRLHSSLDWSPKGYLYTCSHSSLPGLLLEPPKCLPPVCCLSTPPSHHPVSHFVKCTRKETRSQLPTVRVLSHVDKTLCTLLLAESLFEYILQSHKDICCFFISHCAFAHVLSPTHVRAQSLKAVSMYRELQ